MFGLIFGAFLYSLMMTHQLTNAFDGLWIQNYYHAGLSELTSGRWMLYFVDKLAMGLHADPIASLWALSLYVLGFVFVLDLFRVENKAVGFLCIALWISSTVICNTLSYRKTSLGYSFAYLFSVVGVFSAVMIKNRIAAISLSGLSICLSMACYQTYLGVFCIVALFYIIWLCNRGTKEEGSASILHVIVRFSCSLVIGAIFYLISLHFFLKLNGASLSSYNGANNITLSGLICGLPESIYKTYRYFATYFLTDTLKLNRLQYFGGFYLLLALLVGSMIMIGVHAWKTSKIKVIILLLAVPAVPIACNAYMLLAGDKLELQMTAGLAMLVPLTMIMVFSCIPQKKALHFICVLICSALLYGNAMQVWFDQEAMYEGDNACHTIATQIIEDLKDNDLLSSEYEYFFVGVPARNELFSVSEIYACANGYAQMGNFWVSGSCLQLSYHGLINKRMGFNLPLSLSYLLYENVSAQYDVESLPVFPADGYITVFDDHLVVIKISEYEKYCEYSSYAN